MPSTVGVSRISPVEGDRDPPPLLRLLRLLTPRDTHTQRGHEANRWLPMSSLPSTAHSQGVPPASVCSFSAGTPVLQQPAHYASYLATAVSFLLPRTLAPVTTKGGQNSFPSLALCFDK